MNSVLKNVCKLKVPLKVVEHPHSPCAPCKTEILTVIRPKSTSSFNSSRSYSFSLDKEQKTNGLITLQTCPKLPCSYRRNFTQKTTQDGYERSAPCEENDKKKDEVTEEQCISPKNDKREKKAGEKSLKFTINLNEIIHSFNRKNNLVKAQGINKINTFSLKPGRCKSCTSRKKDNLDKIQQKRYMSFSSKGGVQFPRYQVNKIRKTFSYKHHTGGVVSHKMKQTCYGRHRNEKLFKVPLFYILKDKIHSNSQVVQELTKGLRYHIGTNEALFGNSSPTLKTDKKLTKRESSQVLNRVKSKHEEKSCILSSDVNRKISEYKLNFDNLKKNHILQMLSQILIPMIERESMQYEEMRKAFVHLQKELEIYFKEMKSSKIRSENEIFKIISNINQAKKHQKELEAIPLCTKVGTESNSREKSENSLLSDDKHYLYGNCSDSTSSNKICTPNCQLDEFPIAIMVKDRKQTVEPQNVSYSYLGLGNSTKSALTVRSSESENKYIPTRTYASDSKSTRREIRDELEKPFNSFIDQESDAGCFQYFQSKSIPNRLAQKPKEQFTIPLEPQYRRDTFSIKSHDAELPKESTRNEENTPTKLKPTSSKINESNKSIKPSSHSSFTPMPKKEVEPKITSQAPLSKAGMKNLKKVIKSGRPKEAEVRLPFEDDVSKKSISVETMKVKKEPISDSKELPVPMKPAIKLKNVEPKTVLKNTWKPKKIIKSNSSPTLKSDSEGYQKNVDKMCSEKSTPLGFLENCRGMFETICHKLKGPPKRSLGSYLSRKSHSSSSLNTIDTDKSRDEPIAEINKPAVSLKLKDKYPWNRLRINEKIGNGKSESKREYSTSSRKYSFSKKGLMDYSFYCHTRAN